MKYIKAICLTIVLGIFLISCGSGGGGGSTSDAGKSKVTIVIGSNESASNERNTFYAFLNELLDVLGPSEAGALIPPEVYRVVISITGLPSDEIIVSGQDQIIRTYDVPHGPNRVFRAEAYDVNGVLRYRGETVKDIYGPDYVRIYMEQICIDYILQEIDPVFENISDSEAEIVFRGDEVYRVYNLPWDFTFYGRTYRQITIDSNGNIWFEYEGSDYRIDLPTGNGHGPVISVWNDNLSTAEYGEIKVVHRTDPERVIVLWDDTETKEKEGADWLAAVEIVLYQNGDIQFNYGDIDSDYVRGNGSADYGSGISSGDGVNYVNITDAFGPAYTLRERSFLFPFPTCEKRIKLTCLGGSITLNSVNDTRDVNPGDGVCADASGNCTLRAAIMEANACIGWDEIIIPAGTYLLSITGTGEDASATGDLDIVDDLTITGEGASTTIIDGGGIDRVIDVPSVASGIAVELSGVTIQGGNTSDRHGGGIRNHGTFTIKDSIVTGNSNSGLEGGGGIANFGTFNATDVTISNNTVNVDGGGVFNKGSSAVFNATRVTIDSNTAGQWGGGVLNYGATFTAIDTTISNNTDTGLGGGGITNIMSDGTFNATRMTVINNYSYGNGGGIFNGYGAEFTATDLIVRGNQTAAGKGGGIFNHYLYSSVFTGERVEVSNNTAVQNDGGGVWNDGGATMSLTNATISGNTAKYTGGIGNNGTFYGYNITVTHNSSSTGSGGVGGIFIHGARFHFYNSIIANQTQGPDCDATFDSLDTNINNLDSDGTCGASITADPLLGPLQDNGGLTLTHALSSGSPAIDAGDNTYCPSTDQRGYSRPVNGACDIGAYEYQ